MKARGRIKGVAAQTSVRSLGRRRGALRCLALPAAHTAPLRQAMSSMATTANAMGTATKVRGSDRAGGGSTRQQSPRAPSTCLTQPSSHPARP